MPVMGKELYIREEIIQEEETLTWDDVFFGSDGNSKLKSFGDNPGLLSLIELRETALNRFGNDSVIIGNRPVYLPKRISENSRPFYSEILKELKKVFPEPEQKIEILSVTPEYAVQNFGKKTAEFRYLRKTSQSVSFSCRYQDGYQETITVGYVCRIPVLTAEKNLYTGESILPEDFTTKLIDIRELRYEEPVLKIEEDDWIAGKYIHAGKPLKKRDIAVSFPVNKGDKISIIIERGSIKLKLTGTAMKSGRIGEMIDVRPYQGSHILEAEVINEKEAYCGKI